MIKNYFIQLGMRPWFWRLYIASFHTFAILFIGGIAVTKGYVDIDPLNQILFLFSSMCLIPFVYLFVLPRLVPKKLFEQKMANRGMQMGLWRRYWRWSKGFSKKRMDISNKNWKKAKEDWKEAKEDFKDNVKGIKEDTWKEIKEEMRYSESLWKMMTGISIWWKEIKDKKNMTEEVKIRNKFPETIEKIRKPITDKRVIKINADDFTSWWSMNSREDFCNVYTVKYMPTLLHEIREELVDEMIENKVKYPRWEKFITKQYDPCLAKKEVEKDFLSGIVRAVDYPMCALLVEIMFEKLTEYFLENGWTLSENQFQQEEFTIIPIPMNEIVNKQVFYLHPPKN